jgi:hypothetical protein
MPKLKLDTVNSAKIGKMRSPSLVILCIIVITYINMLPKSDQMFQTRSGLEKNIMGLKDGIAHSYLPHSYQPPLFLPQTLSSISQPEKIKRLDKNYK